MKLLIVTQTVDKNDLVLGFFHRWLEELAKRVELITVICLSEGAHDLPANVRVYSLGKEGGRKSRAAYAARFLTLCWNLRHDYNVVFVHMNQEYILLAGNLWWALRKPVYLWRNHYQGSWVTDIAALYCRKVFYTSRFSYTARYGNALQMPVGVDTDRFSQDGHGAVRKKNSLLFFSRIAPSKHPETFIHALKFLKDKGITFTASIYGDPLPKDERYYERLKEKAEEYKLSELTFKPGVPNVDAPHVFRAYEVFVNCSRSGMFDKVIFEAAACGSLPLASSEDFRTLAGPQFYFDGSARSLAMHLETLLALPPGPAEYAAKRTSEIAETHSLHNLVSVLVRELRV